MSKSLHLNLISVDSSLAEETLSTHKQASSQRSTYNLSSLFPLLACCLSVIFYHLSSSPW